MISIENFHQCLSIRNWEAQVGEYTVRHEYTSGGEYQYDFTCTCPAFKFRKGYCKHIKSVKDDFCGWHEQFEGGDLEDGKCPKCGGEVEIVRCAV